MNVFLLYIKPYKLFVILIDATCKTGFIKLTFSISLHEPFTEAFGSSEQINICDSLTGWHKTFYLRYEFICFIIVMQRYRIILKEQIFKDK